MTHSYVKLYAHLVFTTKYRERRLYQQIRPDLINELHRICEEVNSPALIINGVTDHMHLLIRLSKRHSLAKVVEEIKKQSSKWMKTCGEDYADFRWQVGYAAFSVDYRHLDGIIRYIRNQQRHHGESE